MDAAEADADVKLYKASGELLLELRAKIPQVVRSSSKPHRYRKWVLGSKIYETTQLLDRFQEWPQLLDPYLAGLVQILVDAYLWYCTQFPSEYTHVSKLRDDSTASLEPLPRAVARLLYTFCKVRGRKVIVRLLNNEPKYVEPLLKCFQLWTSGCPPRGSEHGSTMTWEERYIHLLWLSHLMLAPFELSTISGLSINGNTNPDASALYANIPEVSASLLSVGLEHLYLPSKAREAASTLLVRLSLRSDMRKLQLPERLVSWALGELNTKKDPLQFTNYHYIGLLELVFGILNLASDSEAVPFLKDAFQIALVATTSSEESHKMIRDSAPARKLLIKIMRSTLVHALSIEAAGTPLRIDIDLQSMLEDSIQTMLDFLADKDTPVRQAASKALSLICLKLDADMATEVMEAVVASLNENLLLEDVLSGRLFPVTDVTKDSSVKYKKNLNAVDPLKWHGCMLTLGHLLFRRSLPTSQLSGVVEALVMGLDFEQRSNVGTSVGVGVRDAACFGIWSLARKYYTHELNETFLPVTLLSNPETFAGGLPNTTIQLIATHLAVSACLDPSGNLRRGSSAALQELIGRHPDVIAQGISVVQTIDYHAVARRSRATTEVAIAASRLSSYYSGGMVYALLGWRGARATDADSRRQAAQAAGSLASIISEDDLLTFLRELASQIDRLKPSNTGSNAAARHGLLCTFAAIIENLSDRANIGRNSSFFEIFSPLAHHISSTAGDIAGRVTNDVELIFESVCKTVLACSHFMSSCATGTTESITRGDSAQWAASTKTILERCTIYGDADFATGVAAQANIATLKMLGEQAQCTCISSWMDQQRQGRTNFTCKGLITTLGQAFEFVAFTQHLERFVQPIIMYLSNIVESSYPIELKVHAMQSVNTIVTSTSHLGKDHLEILAASVCRGLIDYTTDRRGDIGSALRLEAIETAKSIMKQQISEDRRKFILQSVVKLAAEKLVKVRLHAWKCLEECFKIESPVTRTFDHQADVSGIEYFRTLVEFLNRPQYQNAVVLGIMTSIAGGTEEVSRACSEALVALIGDQDAVGQVSLTSSIIQSLSSHLAKSADSDDAEVIPAINLLTFVIEHVLASQPNLSQEDDIRQAWTSCQKAHVSSSTFLRLEAMIRLYSALTSLKSHRIPALDKLTRLLLHRWPRIRGVAADAIFLSTSASLLPPCNWNAPVSDNKSTVLALRKELGVAGPAVANAVQNSTAGA